MTKKQKSKFRAIRFAKHLSRFVDLHRFPDFKLTNEIIEVEAKRQTHGESKLSDHEKEIIIPLRDAQRWKEVTLNGIREEADEFRRNGWGWIYPIIAEFEHARNDWIMKKAILEIKKSFHNPTST